MKLLLFFVMLCFCSQLWGQEKIPTILKTQVLEDSSEVQRFIWRTDPGIRYTLQSSTDLKTWTTVEGFPRVAEGPVDYYDFDQNVEEKFFQAIRLDEQAPTIVTQYPIVGGFAVPRFEDIEIQLSEYTSIDGDSIELQIGDFSPCLLYTSDAADD